MATVMTKIGNLKVGRVKDGGPEALDRILVTTATKEGEANFRVWDGFPEEGATEVPVMLPFNTPETNFEVSYVGFVRIGGVDYMMKAEDIGHKVYYFPLYAENEGYPVYESADVLTEEDLDGKYRGLMKKSGILRVMVPGASGGYGEVFYYKTSSVNSISAIENQLRFYSAALGNKLGGKIFTLRTYRRENGDGEGYSFVSIDLPFAPGEELKNLQEQADAYYEGFDFDAVENYWVMSRQAELKGAIALPEDAEIEYVTDNGEVVNIGSDGEAYIEDFGEWKLDEEETAAVNRVAKNQGLPPMLMAKWIVIKRPSLGEDTVAHMEKMAKEGAKAIDFIQDIKAEEG